jgi:transposase
LRLPSDLTDVEWVLLEPLLPSRKKLGRPPKWTYREIINGMLFILRAGLPWRMIPRRDFPSVTTIQHYFYAWRDSGLWKTLNRALLMAGRPRQRRT